MILPLIDSGCAADVRGPDKNGCVAMAKAKHFASRGSKKTQSKKQSFLHGALILTLSIVIVKLIGMLFKVPLTWIITEEGMGYFGTAYNFYSPIFSLATAGFPIAISKMVSENYTKGNFRDIRQIHRASIPIFLVTGGVGFLIMFFGAGIYVDIINNPLSRYAMLALSPAILFSCLSSIYRGYYEGLRNMYPTAFSEVFEALGKLALGLTAAYLILQNGLNEFSSAGTVFGMTVAAAAGGMPTEADASAAILPFAAAGAIFGVTFGSFLSFFYLFIYHKVRGDGVSLAQIKTAPKPKTVGRTAKILIKTAFPIGIGAIAINIAGLIDTTFLQTRIKSIVDTAPGAMYAMYEGLIPERNLEVPETIPNFLYGCYTNALTLYMLIPSITQAFGISALPSMTAAWTKGDRGEIKTSMEAVIRITALFSIPAGLGMSALAFPISKLIYGDRGAVEITAMILIIMGIAAIFASLGTPLNSMLQAVGRVDLPVKILCIGLLVKMLVTYVLSGIPEINVLGAGVGTLVCYAFAAVAAVIYLCKITRIVPNMASVFLKPFLAAALCAAAAWGAYTVGVQILPDYGKYITLAAILFACVVYVIALLLLKAISKDDILMLPKGQKIAKVLEKHHWIG